MALADWFLSPAERQNPHAIIDAVRGNQTAWTVGNDVRPIVHGAPYFAELAERITGMGPGDRVYFVDWRGDPDQRLNDAGETLVDVLTTALGRGVDVRGLLWRSHWHKIGLHSERAFALGKAIEAAGGQCLRDMRVRSLGSHHQKFVILRHQGDPARDVAYVGGIDLCHSRRDDIDHLGDEQALDVAAEYGPRPAWHDVQAALSGPAVHDVETTFRERWEDSTPLTLNPGRRLTSLLQAEDQEPRPLGEQWPPPPRVDGAHDAVQIVRTYPAILPVGYDFAPEGERSIVLGNAKAMSHARRLIYVEDQYLWGTGVGEHFATMLRNRSELRLVIVLPIVPDVDGAIARTPQLAARLLALEPILEAGGDRVAVFGLTNSLGLPVYVHSKICIIDDRWASVGSDNFNRRSWTSDSEIACAVMDDRLDDLGEDEPSPPDAFPLRLRRTLCAEHLGVPESAVPHDPDELFDALVAAATRLDEWYAAGAEAPQHLLRRLRGSARIPRRVSPGRARRRVASRASTSRERSLSHAERPPGQLRALDPPELSRAKRLWAERLVGVIDPDGTVLREEELPELSAPGP
ncbi:MAG: phospholipase D family protein [Dermatophilaceae bacterium]|nr:phospholipase D-like domain-containing protein [Intrasporangiaceae bacterium]